MSEVRNVPKLRFPEYKYTWTIKQLGSCFSVLRAGKDKPEEDGDFLVYGSTGPIGRSSNWSWSGKTILVARVGANAGKLSFVTGEFGVTDNTLIIKLSEQSSYEFFYAALERFNLNRLVFGSGQPLITGGHLGKIKLHLPSFPEQQKIASFLTDVDRRIELLQQKKEKLERYKKGVMQQLFTRKIRFRADDGSEFPDWEEKKLGEVARIFDGTHQTPKYVDKGIAFYSVEHVTANQFTKSKFISEKVFEAENKKVKLEKGDILMTKIGSIGVARYIDWDVKASFYVSLALLKVSAAVNSEFLTYYISTVDFQKELWKRTIHVAFPQKINLGEIGECLIRLPSNAEQVKIAQLINSLNRSLVNLEKQIQHSQTWKKGLLQQMFV